ncbi:MAG: M48 family metallopeptidase, partial [Caulobacteraceae bacterium]|nr:M48 family metallopeptidase [Caulobacter sp.]
IRYTWRLVCAPTPVLDYVVAHEAAHLREPNHGAGFWALNRELYGAALEPPRAWLKAHGAELHALGG